MSWTSIGRITIDVSNPCKAIFFHTREIHTLGLVARLKSGVAGVIINLFIVADLVLRAATVLEVARVEAEAVACGFEAEASSLTGAGLSDARRTGY